MENCILCRILELYCESLFPVEYPVASTNKPMRNTEPSFTSVTIEKNVHTTLGSPVEEPIVSSIQILLLSFY